MGPVEALKLALQKEIEAAQMYEKFSIEYPTAKETFIYLKGEEEF
jgi:rubrerythrin